MSLKQLLGGIMFFSFSFIVCWVVFDLCDRNWKDALKVMWVVFVAV